MRNVIAARTIHIVCLGVAVTGMNACSDDNRLRSEDVTFPDPALQACFEEILTTPSGKPYADEIELLRCNFSNIVSLEGIEVLSGLTELNLAESSQLEDLEPILSLSSLSWLDLADCSLEPDSTIVLSQLKTPVRLNISGNNLEDISAYAAATSLVGLIAIDSNVTTGVAELITLTNAEVLSFGGNPGSPCVDLEFLRERMPESTRVAPSVTDVEPGVDCAP